MYFDNITNEELNLIPKPYVHNFSISLTSILHKTGGAYDNGLFKIEEINSTIFKVYPLFNCKKITSTNPSDKIFDNRLILCNKVTKETYVTFISDENEPVQDYTDYGSYKKIGDTLTTAEYNSIVQLIRANGTIEEAIHIQSQPISTEYGDYQFTFTGLIVDNGIKITSLTTLKCKLTNQAFSRSTYTLKLKALRIANTNIESDDDTDNKTIIPVTVELVNGTDVNIPTSNLETGDIILFDGTVTITHDKPVLNGSWVNEITLTGDKSIIQTNEHLALTATVKDQKTVPMVNTLVEFYKWVED